MILYRPGPRGHEVFLTRRSTVVRSFPGFWVFPGGKQDPEDIVLAQTLEGSLNGEGGEGFIQQAAFQKAMAPEFAAMLHAQPRLEDHSAWNAEDWQALAVTALRELWEETGLALMQTPCSSPAALARQEGLLFSEEPFARLLENVGLTLDLSGIAVAGRITTPDLGPKTRRFDTAFFLARAPEPLPAPVFSQEIDEGCWMRPADALEEFGPEQLAIPTRYILRQLHHIWNGEGGPQ